MISPPNPLTERQREVHKFRINIQLRLECCRCNGIWWEDGEFQCRRCGRVYSFEELVDMAVKAGLIVPDGLEREELYDRMMVGDEAQQG